MVVEAPILDGDEGVRDVARQFLQRDDFAAHVAAHGERVAADIHDLDRGWALGNFERLDRRQVRAGPGDGGDAADAEPEAEHQAPINEAAEE